MAQGENPCLTVILAKACYPIQFFIDPFNIEFSDIVLAGKLRAFYTEQNIKIGFSGGWGNSSVVQSFL
jgi:hypothetical protein